jgi:Flp pilus assembly protein TadD
LTVLLVGLSGLLLSQSGCATFTQLFSPPGGVTPMAQLKDDAPHSETVKLSLMMAQNLDKMNKGDEAIEHYERVLAQEPNNLVVLRRLAVLYDRHSPPQFPKAEAAYKKLAEARPRDADLLNDWGYSYFMRHDLPEAEKKLRKALEIDAKNDRAHCNLGLVLGHEERQAEALQQFRAAGLSDAEAHCNLGFIYWSRGKLEDARRECKVALAMNANCPKAIEILVELDRPARPKGKGAGGNRATARAPERTSPPSLGQPVTTSAASVAQEQPLPAGAFGQGDSRWAVPPGWQPVTHLRPPVPPPAQEEMTPQVTTGTITLESP